ncbi:hypothetical protein OG2516_12784 [Oceanicola granulosus HTCC2516]|uniref:Uncharacterized protein n=1 Tax=Oceanicola granulosus (strain ATCC BAA-861 / DSM 15982 / KCTC 12143 / HTCC2516) TaxID=314256 RepID=Q2CC24_OCEGH|nr:hypothetical protein [Oceanicola granulosus]EAR50257.1 hypothetical protein OG2516_12784 [Oceanicola granulosus HTCC2516]
MRYWTHILVISTAILAFDEARAQSFIVKVDDQLVGDWSCGDARLYVTELGSIEILDDGYRAGFLQASDGKMEVEWEEGGQEVWDYMADREEITLISPDQEEVLTCRPR